MEIGESRWEPTPPSFSRLTSLRFRSAPQHTYGFFPPRPHGKQQVYEFRIRIPAKRNVASSVSGSLHQGPGIGIAPPLVCSCRSHSSQ